MKIFKLKKFMKSEFKPDPEKTQLFYEIIESCGLRGGRMIGGSKCCYMESHQENVIVFNANIITKTSGKCWYGDLDITLDFDKLKEAADKIGEDLYILREHDARFENEDKDFKFYKSLAKEIIKSDK